MKHAMLVNCLLNLFILTKLFIFFPVSYVLGSLKQLALLPEKTNDRRGKLLVNDASKTETERFLTQFLPFTWIVLSFVSFMWKLTI